MAAGEQSRGFDFGTAIAAFVIAVALIVIYLLPSQIAWEVRVGSAVIVGAGLVFAGLSWGGFFQKWGNARQQRIQDRRVQAALSSLTVELEAVNEDVRMFLRRDAARTDTFLYLLQMITERGRTLKNPATDRLDGMRYAWQSSYSEVDNAVFTELYYLIHGPATTSYDLYRTALDMVKAEVGAVASCARYALLEMRNGGFLFPAHEADQWDAFRAHLSIIVGKVQHLIQETQALTGIPQMNWYVEAIGAVDREPPAPR